MTPSLPPDDRLYRLLPAIYRLRDGARGEPLRALLAVFEQELRVLEADIDGLYDNWFVETCDDWVVPYIGDLLDVQELYAGGSALTYGQQERRAHVANTLAYRRRKGTTPILEQLTQDVTGWRSRAVEFGRLLATSQNLNHVRPTSAAVSLRANNRLEEVGTPFEQQAAYSAELRPPRRGGRYNVPTIGLYVWRLQSYPLHRVQARAVAGPEDCPGGSYYTFNPLGQDGIPLFNQPQTKTDIVSLAQEINVPAILRRPVLAAELQDRRQTREQGRPITGIRYFDTDPVLQIFLDGQPQALAPESIRIQSLATQPEQDSDSGLPPWVPREHIPWDDGIAAPMAPAQLVAVDPVLGRLVVRGAPPTRVDVSYFYGFSDDLGGGPYPRLEALPRELAPTPDSSAPHPLSPWHWSVQCVTSTETNPLAAAIDAWNRTVVVRYGFRVGTHIPVALVTLPPVQVAQVHATSLEASMPDFRPGIVWGLQVRWGLCPAEIVISAGVAIDRDGHRLALDWSWTVNLGNQFQEVIPTLPDATGVLVLYYRPTLNGNQGRSPSVGLALMVETALTGYPLGTVIPLITVTFDHQGQAYQLCPLAEGSAFRAGIVHGLEVHTRPGTLETWITPGTGVDAEGNRLVVTNNDPVDLTPHQGSVQAVIGVPSARSDRQIRLVPEAELATLTGPYLPLALLEIPQVSMEPLIYGSSITVTPLGRHRLDVGPGEVTLASGQPLTLKRPQRLDLSAFAGRTVAVFVSAYPDQGWAVPIQSSGREQDPAYAGVIPVNPPPQESLQGPPQEPDWSTLLALNSLDRGWVVIGDSATYRGDLAIALPPHTRLHLVAADGCRPHISGDLVVQGWAEPPEAHHPLCPLALAELLCNGLLVAGQLHLLPGSLGKLSLHHCTLVPGVSRLQVESVGADEGSPSSEFPLLAFVISCLLLIWQLIGREMGLTSKAHTLTMGQLLRAMWQQLVVGLATSPPTVPGAEVFAGLLQGIPLVVVTHDRLEIDLERTITGPLCLAATVPQLSIHNSLIDKGTGSDSSAGAIAAPGTRLNMSTTTVLGRTTARFLEASDCLFTETVTVERHQEGCIRFSYVPVTSSTPRRYQCQPDIALRQVLEVVPGGVSALTSLWLAAATPAESSAQPRVIAATDGDGLFSLWPTTAPSTPAPPTETWQAITGDLSDRALTAAIAYRWPQPSSESDAAPQEMLVVGTATGRVFRLLDPSLQTPQPDWRPLPLPDLNAAITALYPDQETGTGQVTLSLIEPASDGASRAQIKGDATRFSAELQVADVIIINRIPWRVEQLGSHQGRGGMTSRGRQVTLESSLPADTWAEHDTITVTRLVTQADQRQPLIQTRTIVASHQEVATSIRLTLDAPFEPDIESPQDPSFILNIDRELVVKAVVAEPVGVQPPASEFTIQRLWVATAGGGLWRGAIDGQAWQPMNPGLTTQSLTAVLRDRQQRLWVGTQGGGIFQLLTTDGSDRWVPMNQGLTTGTITALTLVGESLLAATDQGMVRLGPDRDTWDAANPGLTTGDMMGSDITGVAALPEPIASTVSGEGTRLTGNQTFFQREGLQPGAELTLAGQTVVVEQVLSDTHLVVQEPGLSTVSNLPYRRYQVAFAGTRDGKVFGSIDGGQTWQPLGLDLRGTPITALMVVSQGDTDSGAPQDNDVPQLWLGTGDGSVLRSLDLGQTWQTLSEGRPDVIKKLQIINQLQPTFTSTTYGTPGYGQLRQTCPPDLCTGAEDGAEMGVFNALKQPQRAANLTASLDEYLRFGMSAGIFYMT